MQNNFVKGSASVLLISSIWFGALAMPLASFAQEQPKEAAKSDKKDKADKSAKPAATTPATLSAKDDPSQIGKRNINKGSDKFFGWLGGSKEKEMQVGRQLALEIEQQAKLVDDPVITEYINRVGQNVVLHSDAKVPFTIKVIDSDEVNAFALPGGYFFVNRGLILAADNEAELAGVMAHEIAHVCARHAMETQGKGAFINYAAIAGIMFGGPILSGIVQNAGGILSSMAGLKFNRGAEIEADNLGVQYLYASGYDPTAMSTMFEKLASQKKNKPGTVARLFSTHPQSTDRRDTSLQLVTRFPEKEEYVINTSEFQRVKGHLFKLTNARAGITTDYDQADDSKPTLKKRQPDAPDSPDAAGGESSSTPDNGPPKLKKRDQSEDPQPVASPSPGQ